MRNWFLSLNGAITLSLIAFLTFLGRLFLDWMYEMAYHKIANSDTITVLFFGAFAGGWVWAMLAAICGSRRGLIACLIFALFLDVLFALATRLSMCPPGCRGFPNLWPWTWTQLISGLLADIALVFQLRQKKAVG